MMISPPYLEERFLHTHSRERQQIFRSFARDHLVNC
jgi:hypothetical protein